MAKKKLEKLPAKLNHLDNAWVADAWLAAEGTSVNGYPGIHQKIARAIAGAAESWALFYLNHGTSRDMPAPGVGKRTRRNIDVVLQKATGKKRAPGPVCTRAQARFGLDTSVFPPSRGYKRYSHATQ